MGLISLTPLRRGAVWTPLSSPNIDFDYESDVGTSITSGSLNSWTDQHRSLVITSGPTKPGVVSADLNGYPGFSFDGSATYMAGASHDVDFSTGQAYSFYAVLKLIAFSGTQYYCVIHGGIATTAGAFWLTISNDTTYGNLFAGKNANGGFSGTSRGTNLTIPSGSYAIFKFFYNGSGDSSGNYAGYVDTTTGSASAGGATSETGTIFNVGRRQAGDSFLHGNMVSMYRFLADTRSNGEDALMTTYLTNKYGAI